MMVTGANGGGKSTFLRSVGLAQLMMQCGMFVAAESLQADVSDGVFTHFRREEDAGMEKGKLGEELSRMSEIVNDISPGCLLLCNESVASTNESGRVGDRPPDRASADRRWGQGLLRDPPVRPGPEPLLPRAPPTPSSCGPSGAATGARPFLLREAAPLPTGFGEDLYRQVFGPAGDAGPVAQTGTGP